MSDATCPRRHDSTPLVFVIVSAVLGAMSLVSSEAISAADSGTIKGAFVVEPEDASSDASRSTASKKMGMHDGAEQRKTRPLQGAIVWLPAQRGLPDGEKEIPEGQRVAELRIKDRVWRPRLLILQKGQHLRIVNEDPFRHFGIPNVRERNGKLAFEMDQTLWGKGNPFKGRSTLTLKELPAFRFPHVWGTCSPGGRQLEKVVVFVRPTAYWAITDRNGQFEIRGVPVGTWKVKAWHKDHCSLRFVQANGKERYRHRGRFSVTVKPHQTTDVGVVTVLEHLPDVSHRDLWKALFGN